MIITAPAHYVPVTAVQTELPEKKDTADSLQKLYLHQLFFTAGKNLLSPGQGDQVLFFFQDVLLNVLSARTLR